MKASFRGTVLSSTAAPVRVSNVTRKVTTSFLQTPSAPANRTHVIDANLKEPARIGINGFGKLIYFDCFKAPVKSG
jgi:hypothetical protein